MQFIPDLLFVPAEKQRCLGEPFMVDAIPHRLLSGSLFPEGRAPASEIVFGTLRTHRGLLSLYCSPSFEREIASKAEIETAYCHNTKPMLEFMFPPEEIEKVSANIASLLWWCPTQLYPVEPDGWRHAVLLI
jgi:hypothetical protein